MTFFESSKLKIINNTTDERDKAEKPKCRAMTNGCCPKTTAPAPINPCKIIINTERIAKNLASRTCFNCFQAKKARIITRKPAKPDTIRCVYSMTVSMAGFNGTTSPKHRCHVFPHPSPDPVFETSAPWIRTSSTNKAVMTPKTLNRLCTFFTF